MQGIKIVIVEKNRREGGLNNDQIKKIKAINPKIEVSTNESDIPEAEIIITSTFEAPDIKKLPKLKWIHVDNAGVDRMPQEIKDSDIILTNSSGVHPIPISETVWGYIFMWTRQLTGTYRSQVLGKGWSRDGLNMDAMGEADGKTMLIVGMGRIGSRIAETARAFNMRIVGVVRDPSKSDVKGVELVSTKELEKYLKASDFVVDCLPLTAETRGIFNLNTFKKFKKGCFFINIGRGGTVVEKDLVQALNEGIVAGAGLDVFEVEPLPKSSPLWNMENVILTPHVSGWTPYYRDRAIDIFCENLKAYLDKKPMPNVVDKKLGY